MEPFPHHYRVAARTEPTGLVTLTSEGLAPLESSPPLEFGGSGTDWSPETLLIAAVVDCYALSLRAVAEASKLAWKALHCEATGTLESSDTGNRFTHVALQAELTIGSGTRISSAERVMRKAKDVCLITNSLSAECTLDASVTGG